jgi:hypothetical protein
MLVSAASGVLSQYMDNAERRRRGMSLTKNDMSAHISGCR